MNSIFLKYIWFQTAFAFIYIMLLYFMFGGMYLAPEWAKTIYFVTFIFSIWQSLTITEKEEHYSKIKTVKFLMAGSCIILLSGYYLVPVFQNLF